MRMHIVLLNNYFPPEIGAASHLYYDLGVELTRRNYKVTVLTGTPRYNVSPEIIITYEKNGKKYCIENLDGLNIIRVKLPIVDKHKKIRRGIEHFEIACKLLKGGKAFLREKVDAILVYSPPLTLGITAVKLSKHVNAPVIFNVQDLFPKEAIDVGLIKNKIVINYFKHLEKTIYNRVDLITVHSSKNKKYVSKIVRSDEKVVVVENWLDISKIVPGPKENAFSKKHALTKQFIVSFAGTLGHFQDVEVIIKAAYLLKETKNILFIIVGDGIRKSEAKRLIDKFNLKNVMLLKTVPRNVYPDVLRSSDISLATLNKDLKTPVVPSKILSIMSAGIPVIATMNLDGDAPKLIERAKAGYALPAGDAKGLAEKILELYNNPDLRKKLGKNGREYVEKNLSVQVAADKYEEIFKKVIKEYKRRNKHG